MRKNTELFFVFCETYAGSVLRYGLSALFLWFSFEQFLHNGTWTAYIPDSLVATTHLSANVLVFCNAVFELIFGLLLVFGIQVRLAALLLALHLFDIMYVVGYGEIGVRDFGLALATLVVSMNGADPLAFRPKKPSLLPPEMANMAHTTTIRV